MVKKILAWILVILSLAALVLRFSDKAAELFLGIKQTSGISILSEPTDATVTINDNQAGQTPYENKNLDVGEYKIKIEKNGASWQGRVSLTAGTVAVVNRDLAAETASSAGEILTLDKGKGITIISNPTEADIEIDGKPYGKTPKTIDIESGEHMILINHTNYLKRSIKADLPENFNLTISVDLSLAEVDLTTIQTPVITQTPEVIVKQTPTGFLRVRDKPNLIGKEVAQVKPGEVLTLLEVQGSWNRVRLSNGVEGYVSSSYVEKKNP